MPSIPRFFKKPYGTGSHLNIWMFTPARLAGHVQTLMREPRYFANRIAVTYHQILNPGTPWLTIQAIRFLKSYVRREMAGFEWGAGQSTIWLAERMGTVVSVEHNRGWAASVKAKVQAKGLRNVDLRWIESDTAASYIAPIQEFPDASFDLILIDGEHRNACIRAAAAKVKPAGYIVLDNADTGFDTSAISHFICTATTNGIWRTDIFQRPE